MCRKEDAERVFGRWGDRVTAGQVSLRQYNLDISEFFVTSIVLLSPLVNQVVALQLVGPGSLEVSRALVEELGPEVAASGEDQVPEMVGFGGQLSRQGERDVQGLFGLAEMQMGF